MEQFGFLDQSSRIFSKNLFALSKRDLSADNNPQISLTFLGFIFLKSCARPNFAQKILFV